MKLFNLKTLAALVIGSAVLAGNASAATALRFGYEAPRSDTQHIAAKKFDELLKEKSKGELKLSLFPDSTLGNAQTMIGAVRGGTVEFHRIGAEIKRNRYPVYF